MRHIVTGLLLLAAACASTANTSDPKAAEGSVDQQLATYLEAQVALLQPMDKAANLAWYEASTTGTDAAFTHSKETEEALLRFYADPDRFARLKGFRDGGQVEDPLLARQLEVLYLSMLGKQVEPALLEKINALEKDVEQAFNTFRGKVNGKELTQNEVNKILRNSTDSTELKAAWEAQKAVGPMVAPKLLELVKLRNQVAKQLGYRDFYALKIAEREQDETALLALFDELDTLTREPFLAAKAEVDRRVAARLKLEPAQLMPWHYQNPFFQEPPDVFDTGLDAIYKQQDTLALSTRFYAGIGLEVQDILERSSLYEKEGKSPHAFSADIDRSGDVRILTNIVPGIDWQSTLTHELGHAVYDKYIDHQLPWLLRTASHALITEGLAMMLDRLVGNPSWAESLGLMDAAARDQALPEAKLQQAFAALQFSRWTQVMLRFERELYRDPDQDLNARWWQLVDKYQGLQAPEGRDAPDYASKIHLVIVPVYYHNYMMGELFSAQLHEELAKIAGKPAAETVYTGQAEVGTFLRDKLFAPGRLYRWDELTRRITGQDLKAEAFARRFKDQ